MGEPQPYESAFYESMWRLWGSGAPYPYPLWIQSYFSHWSDAFDQGLFETKQGAFASNASYRYWAMVGLPDQDVEGLVGQAGEIEPIYDKYSLSFFLFDPDARTFHFPQMAGRDARLSQLAQQLEDGYLPIVVTQYADGDGATLEQRAFAAQPSAANASSNHTAIVCQLSARLPPGTRRSWLCVGLLPWGPTGLHRHDRAGRFAVDGRFSHVRYVAAESRVETNAGWGPMFDTPPAQFGTYGNGGDTSDDFYVKVGPFVDLVTRGALNGAEWADDHVQGLCSAVFAWPIDVVAGDGTRTRSIEVRIPVGDFSADDVRALAAVPSGALDGKSLWVQRVSAGLRLRLPARLARYEAQFRLSRIHLVILADEGEIHPGPTIYNSFWVRDSSVEGIACALVGETDLAETQYSVHYPRVFNQTTGRVGPASLYGFFGGEHEKNDLEWDSNGQALWAFGRFDRIMGRAYQFGNGMFTPYVIEAARWIRDNRTEFGLLHSGWSAEHLGGRDKPHYWDDLWAVAGLWEAARMAERINAPAALTAELWSIYGDVRDATAASIRWVLAAQRDMGLWETFIPTGPGDVGRLDSTIIGAVAYFHPCRLYMGAKLGADVDLAARLTLETIWSHFVDGGFRHDSAWNCYGPYLTLQLAHAFLLVGRVDRAVQLLEWAIGNAAYAGIDLDGGRSQVALGAWNEQHCYPIASDFRELPAYPWYMGDIPHGWACAEYLLLLRDMMFFEADEDGEPHVYLIPGVLPGWLGDGETIRVDDAPTLFGGPLSFTATHAAARRQVIVEITAHPPVHHYVLPCHFGGGADSVEVDGATLVLGSGDARIPPGARRIVMTYR